MRTIMSLMLSMMFAVAAWGQSQAFVIYDTLWIHDEKFMDAGVGNAIGGAEAFPSLGVIDVQIAEDFEIDRPVTLTRAFIDIMSFFGTTPAEGIWVQIYRDNDGKPAEEVAFEHVASLEEFEAKEIESPLRFKAWRVDIDLSGMGFDLQEGTWWINFQPLDIETNGDWFWFIGSISIEKIGHPSHVRDGWKAHGNRYRGLWRSTVWIPHDFRGNAVLSWRLEGFGGNVCQYALKKQPKAKGGCDACPDKGDIIPSDQDCTRKRNCEKRWKGTIPCPNGGPGICKKIKGKRTGCGE